MVELNKNIWEFHDLGKWITVTTNGTINSKNEIVMGRGIAKQCKQRYPEFPKLLGDLVSEQGNRVGVFLDYKIISLPVKNNWWEVANLSLIERGLIQLTLLQRSLEEEIYLIRAGCGNGKLDWLTQVKPLFDKYLNSDKFIVCNIGN